MLGNSEDSAGAACFDIAIVAPDVKGVGDVVDVREIQPG